MTTARLLRALPKAVLGDLLQIVRTGRAAPRWAQRIWVDPSRCATVATDLDRGRRMSGYVIGGTWEVAPLETVTKVRMAEEHWRTGRSWEEVGAYDHQMAHLDELSARDGIRTIDDVRRRFEVLDAIFDQVQREGRLRTRRELPRPSIREHNGVYVHIGADGEPIFGNGGCHRLAMARVLELSEIPAQLGVLHPDALPLWQRLRFPRQG